jgi:hypothetical protein
MTALELIKQLADALELYESLSDTGVGEPHRSDVIRQSRMFLDGAVEIDVPGCKVRDATRRWPKLIELARGTHLGEEWSRQEQAVIDTLPAGPCEAVTIIVRPKGAG